MAMNVNAAEAAAVVASVPAVPAGHAELVRPAGSVDLAECPGLAIAAAALLAIGLARVSEAALAAAVVASAAAVVAQLESRDRVRPQAVAVWS